MDADTNPDAGTGTAGPPIIGGGIRGRDNSTTRAQQTSGGRGRGRRSKHAGGRPPGRSRNTTPAAAAQSFRQGTGGNSASGNPSSHGPSVRRTPASAAQPSSGGGSRSAGAGTSNPVRRSSRQSNARVTPGQTSGSAQAPSDHSTGSSRAPSIREGAHNRSRSTGIRGNDRFDIALQRARAEERISRRTTDATMARVEQHAADPAAPESPAGPTMPGQRELRPRPSDNPPADTCTPCPPQTELDRSRICFCDGLPGVGISEADHVPCKGKRGQCDIKFHKHCLRELGWWSRDDGSEPDVYCLQCMTKDDPVQGTYEPDVTWDELEQSSPATNPDVLDKQLFRIGMKRTDMPNTELKQLMHKRLKKMGEILRDDDYKDLLNTTPRAYPTPVRMDDEAMREHVRAGRDVDISTLLYEVEDCKCCGRVQPGHADPLLHGDDSPYKTVPFARTTLVNKYHDAWHCRCEYCNGDQGGNHGQFWPVRRPELIRHYRDKHGGSHPRDFQNGTVEVVRICESCYREVDVKKKDPSADNDQQSNKKKGNMLTLPNLSRLQYLTHSSFSNKYSSVQAA